MVCVPDWLALGVALMLAGQGGAVVLARMAADRLRSSPPPTRKQ